ncbi:hypothetical protein ALC62_13540 [Cyphomyrmex costatus]|uniref:Uncharacterized protein n=1 Tax=Cyphomyrmex costatus TaxID=456900 RepID=A0A151I9S6_9HYME|nr:hypothetical protein ALC62_13540 [Cyphomyrmex costatus]
MGKSSHKSRRRRRSLSGDRLADFENKTSRLINILSRREVRSPSGPSQASSSIILSSQENFGSRNESEPVTRSDLEAFLASLARQEGLTDPKLSEVEENVGEVDDTSSDHPKRVTINESFCNVLT